MKNRTTLVLILVALAVFGLSYYALSSTVRPVQVVVASRDLAAGTPLTAELVELRTIPRGGLPNGTFTNIADVIGKVLVVDRVQGDPLTQYVVGDSLASSGIPAMLEPDTVAIAIHVDQATGLAGILRAGQYVTAIGVIDPASIPQGQLSLYSAPAPALASLPTSAGPATGTPTPPPPTPAPTATPQPPISAAARITVNGLKVLMVPQDFRYEEVAAAGDPGGFLPARTSQSAQRSNVILLQASITPVEIAPGVFASPAETLALLDSTAIIHLVLEPTDGIVSDVDAEGVDLAGLYEAITGYRLNP